ncbi:MAG: serine/threonine-protein kinase [Sandaracinaceae bacterium]
MRTCGQCGTQFREPVQFCPLDGNPTHETYDPDAPAAVVEDPLLGRVVDGRYQVDQQIGEGGMGIVYLATHTVLQKKLALKVLRGENSKDAEVVQRFMQEAQAATSIGHQNIIDISDFGRLHDGSVYFVMEYLDGTSLADMIKRGGSIPMADAIHIVRQMGSALEAAHARGIVHRDLKPDNIFVVKQGGDPLFVKVLDFGVAKVGGAASKLTKTGMVFGTPHYMSPEQAAGHSVDSRTDIYAIGVIMYEMFTGKVPFDADTFMGILSKHMFESPAKPSDVKGASLGPLEEVILKALEKGPENRYQSMSELIADLDTIAGGGSVEVGGRARVGTPGGLAQALEPPSYSDMAIPAEPSGGGLRTVGLALAALVALLAVGGGVGTAVFLFTGQGDVQAQAQTDDNEAPEAPPTPATPAAPPNEAQPTAVLPPTAVPAPAPVMVNIETTPPGAEVLLDGVMVGNTPVNVPRPDQVTELTLRLRGHEDQNIQLGPTSSESLTIALEAERAARVRPRNPIRPAVAPPAPVVRPMPPPVAPPRPPPTHSTSEVVDPWAD